MAPDSSSSSHPPPHSLHTAGDWFLRTSELDNHILTQALTRELSSIANPPCSASSSSPLSSSLAARNPSHSQTSEPDALWVVRALQQRQKQAMSLSSKDCLQRAEESSPAFSHASREHSESSFDNSCLSSPNNTIAMPSTVSTIAMSNTVSIKDQNRRPVFSTSTENPSPAYNTSMALSSQAAVGLGAAKVSKRRSRASNKAPIAVLSTDTSNFRAMVQQLTGIPSEAQASMCPPQCYGSQMLAGHGVPMVKPYSVKMPYYTGCGNLPPTLDTSASLLGRSRRTPLQAAPFVQRSTAGDVTEGGFAIANDHRPNSTGLHSLWESLHSSEQKRSTSSYLANEVVDDLCNIRESPISSDSSAMGPTTTKSTFSAIDSWLAFDGALASHILPA